jgi:hypothetical protein
VTYHCWSASTIAALNVNVYCPALLVVVCAISLKVDWPERSRQSTTWAPDAGGLRVSAPEITTSCPAVEGSGEAEIVSAPGGHGLVQQPAGAQHAAGWQQAPDGGQHVVGWQQVTDGGQHVVGWQQVTDGGQQGRKRGLLVVAFGLGDTTGQQGT